MPMRGLSRIRGALMVTVVMVMAIVCATPILAADNPDGGAVIIGNKT